jgi:hypothetical protein
LKNTGELLAQEHFLSECTASVFRIFLPMVNFLG